MPRVEGKKAATAVAATPLRPDLATAVQLLRAKSTAHLLKLGNGKRQSEHKTERPQLQTNGHTNGALQMTLGDESTRLNGTHQSIAQRIDQRNVRCDATKTVANGSPIFHPSASGKDAHVGLKHSRTFPIKRVQTEQVIDATVDVRKRAKTKHTIVPKVPVITTKTTLGKLRTELHAEKIHSRIVSAINAAAAHRNGSTDPRNVEKPTSKQEVCLHMKHTEDIQNRVPFVAKSSNGISIRSSVIPRKIANKFEYAVPNSTALPTEQYEMINGNGASSSSSSSEDDELSPADILQPNTASSIPAALIPATLFPQPTHASATGSRGQRLNFETKHVAMWLYCLKGIEEVSDTPTVPVVCLPNDLSITLVDPSCNRVVFMIWQRSFFESYRISDAGCKFGLNIQLLNETQNQLSGGGQKGKCMGWMDMPAAPASAEDYDKIVIVGRSGDLDMSEIPIPVLDCPTTPTIPWMRAFDQYPFSCELMTSWIHNTLKQLYKALRRLKRGELVELSFDGATRKLSIYSLTLQTRKSITIEPTNIIAHPFQSNVQADQDSHAVFLQDWHSLDSWRTWDEYCQDTRKNPMAVAPVASSPGSRVPAVSGTFKTFKYRGVFFCRTLLDAVKHKKLGGFIRLYMRPDSDIRIQFLLDQDDFDPSSGSQYTTCLFPLSDQQQSMWTTVPFTKNRRSSLVSGAASPVIETGSAASSGAPAATQVDQKGATLLNSTLTSCTSPLSPTNRKRKRITNPATVDPVVAEQRRAEEARKAAERLDRERKRNEKEAEKARKKDEKERQKEERARDVAEKKKKAEQKKEERKKQAEDKKKAKDDRQRQRDQDKKNARAARVALEARETYSKQGDPPITGGTNDKPAVAPRRKRSIAPALTNKSMDNGVDLLPLSDSSIDLNVIPVSTTLPLSGDELKACQELSHDCEHQELPPIPF